MLACALTDYIELFICHVLDRSGGYLADSDRFDDNHGKSPAIAVGAHCSWDSHGVT